MIMFMITALMAFLIFLILHFVGWLHYHGPLDK